MGGNTIRGFNRAWRRDFDKNQKHLTLGAYERLYWFNLLNLCKILICTTKESDSTRHHSLCLAPAFCWFQQLYIGKGHKHLHWFPLTVSLLSTCPPTTPSLRYCSLNATVLVYSCIPYTKATHPLCWFFPQSPKDPRTWYTTVPRTNPFRASVFYPFRIFILNHDAALN